MGYIWSKHERCIPYLGIGAEVEFGQIAANACGTTEETCHMKSPTEEPATVPGPVTCSENNCCCSKSDCCFDCAISQWGIWLKGGISF
jgi:hypothetical protein